MTDSRQSPFSARNKGAHRQIDADFPLSAKVGLIHLLLDLIERDYVDGWVVIAKELQRIARILPVEYNSMKVGTSRQAKQDAEDALTALSWDRTYDFCERLHGHLSKEVGYHYDDEYQVKYTISEVQLFISNELQRLFEEEELAFEFTEGLVRRRGRKHTVDVTTRAQVVLGDPHLANARKHFEKALQFFRNPKNPDYENTVKEAVCALEAAGKTLFPDAKAKTLGELASWLSRTKEAGIPKTLVQTITGIYSYRSGGEGVGHGGTEGGVATVEIAEYVLAVCASQIILLVDVSTSKDHTIPF